MLRIQKVHAHYGPIEALRGVDIEIKEGEIVSLIGSNGAGKSTCLMTISGVLHPSSGNIMVNGTAISAMAPHKIVEMGISQVPEGRRIFPKLTVFENLEMGAFLGRGNFSVMLENVFRLFPILKERSRQYGGTLSGGEQQMLAIGRALMSKPEILLLDEPSLGLAPIMVTKIFRTIQEINKEGVTILLVEQNARAALKLSDRGYVLENGAVTLEGSSEALLSNEKVRHAYLGE
ncbi:leucine/isoleucine/valine transporter subunit; ATP-binding component of ABC superfamily [Candidatus Sulfobium mesophilum]|uniref:Leucine/isoleucine/valine transporter subunit ATP-binding component of ABC superfamily n=1 Tax=Candidatus Sulfobium mesophilum TaxID=2016548 RepID=A0A2U3QF39_9BACT|nr:leucine/isoleucine/valine transporter subunit; ATP-binding component of ABC superfamily [Candidatus Sulfobium mesophilum]